MKRHPFLCADVGRGYLLGFVTALAFLAIVKVGEAQAREDRYQRVEVVIRTPDGGELGSANNPLRTDPVGTTSQPAKSMLNGPGGVQVQAAGTDGGTAFGAHVPMCFSDACVEITASQVNDGGTATLTAGVWYEVSVSGDGSGGFAGCWANGVALTSCTAKPRLRDGSTKPLAWPAAFAAVDAGALNGKALLYFLSSTTTNMTAVFCPEVPCQ